LIHGIKAAIGKPSFTVADQAGFISPACEH
jgi:hypothetical protein